MLFKKGKTKNAADVFFEGMEKHLKLVKKIVLDMKDISDIKKYIKCLFKSNKFTLKEVYQAAFMREECFIFEIIHSSLIHTEAKNIDIPDESYNILLEDSIFPYDRMMNFAKNLLDLLPLDENKRPGFYEIDVIGDRGLYEAEIIRLGYIKNNAFQKGLSEKDMDPNHLLHSFVDVFKKKVLENPDIDKRELSIAILHAMPKDSFNRQGFCPLFSEK